MLSNTGRAPDQSRRLIPGFRSRTSSLSPLLHLIILLINVNNLSAASAPPKFTKIPTDHIGVSGGVASFVCQATGNPKPVVYWNKKGKKVNSQRIEVVVTVRNVKNLRLLHGMHKYDK